MMFIYSSMLTDYSKEIHAKFFKSVWVYACADLHLTGKIFLDSLELLLQSLLHQTQSFQECLLFLFSLLWPYFFSASLVLITSLLPKPLDIYYLKWSLILLGKYFNHRFLPSQTSCVATYFVLFVCFIVIVCF